MNVLPAPGRRRLHRLRRAASTGWLGAIKEARTPARRRREAAGARRTRTRTTRRGAGHGRAILCHPTSGATPSASCTLERRPRDRLLEARQPRTRTVDRRGCSSVWDGGPVKIADTVSEGDEVAGFTVVPTPGTRRARSRSSASPTGSHSSATRSTRSTPTRRAHAVRRPAHPATERSRPTATRARLDPAHRRARAEGRLGRPRRTRCRRLLGQFEHAAATTYCRGAHARVHEGRARRPRRAGRMPPFTEEHEQLRESIRALRRKELRPHAREWEDASGSPTRCSTRCGELGFLGLKYPEEYGGQGGDYLHDAVLSEELARCGSGGVAAGIGAHIGIATPPIWKFGTEDQKQRFLVPAIRGEKIARARRSPSPTPARTWRASGRSRSAWTAATSSTARRRSSRTACARTSSSPRSRRPQEGGHHGISFLVIEKGMEGFTVSQKLEKLGWHASDTGELAFQDVFVPDENLLGEENKGFYLIMANFQWERLLMALGAVGAMQRDARADDRVRAGAQGVRPPDREAPGDPPQDRRDGGEVEAGRAVTYNALRLFHEGSDAIREVTMAKLDHAARRLRRRRRGPADPRRRRLHERVRRRARGARRPPRPDRRRHRRDHEGDPRASSWGCSGARSRAIHAQDRLALFVRPSTAALPARRTR